MDEQRHHGDRDARTPPHEQTVKDVNKGNNKKESELTGNNKKEENEKQTNQDKQNSMTSCMPVRHCKLSW